MKKSGKEEHEEEGVSRDQRSKNRNFKFNWRAISESWPRAGKEEKMELCSFTILQKGLGCLGMRACATKKGALKSRIAV